MPTQHNRTRLLLVSILALVLTVAGAAAMGYAWLSTRATRWGDSLIIGPRFNGEAVLDGGATRLKVWREDGVPVLDAPAWRGRGQIYVTFVWGFAIYHTPPGTMSRGTAPAK
jgi:hypothetical protein